EEGTSYFYFTLANEYFILYYMLNSLGSLEERVWSYDKKDWLKTLTPRTDCDVYGKCGLFGICDPEAAETICSCLGGFEPKNSEEWNSGNWSS
ncbi:hypothetical protein, partial [Escherichia coli]|uniref:hypothetical protein n=1 Tax=Escherichia coli TaxID=562 RepID=UPI00200F0532